MTSTKQLVLALLAAGALAGCSSVKLDPDAPVENRTPVAVTPGANSGAQSTVAPVNLGNDDAMAMSKLPRVVLFDFDSYVVKDEFRNVVEANAKVLAADRKKHVAIEGHTDDQGGSEYNLALGQKRAEAVSKSLALLGANESQMEAVSFGKERPAVQGTDDEARAKNRRAELNYR